MTSLRRYGFVARSLAICAFVLMTLLARPAAADDPRPLQLEVFINDTPTERIGTFAQLAEGKLAATRSELAELGVSMPGNGADDETIVLDGASGMRTAMTSPASESISSSATSDACVRCTMRAAMSRRRPSHD